MTGSYRSFQTLNHKEKRANTQGCVFSLVLNVFLLALFGSRIRVCLCLCVHVWRCGHAIVCVCGDQKVDCRSVLFLPYGSPKLKLDCQI